MVEDEATIRTIVAAILRKHGYRPVSCCDGVKALAILGANPGRFSLVLTDVDMPRIGGVALARALSEQYPKFECCS